MASAVSDLIPWSLYTLKHAIESKMRCPPTMLQWHGIKDAKTESHRQRPLNIFFLFINCFFIMTANSPHSTMPCIWYRTTLFNAFIIGGVGFVAPGLWDAMNALGAGGAEKPYLINAANALVFGLSKKFLFPVHCQSCPSWLTNIFSVGFLCLFGAPFANRIGLNWTLLLGGIGYPIYSLIWHFGLWLIICWRLLGLVFTPTTASWVYNEDHKVTYNQWVNLTIVYRELNGLFSSEPLPAGSRKLIISHNYSILSWAIFRAGLFWASEGAVALGYPEASKRGKYLKYVFISLFEYSMLITVAISGSGFGLEGLSSVVPLYSDWISKPR